MPCREVCAFATRIEEPRCTCRSNSEPRGACCASFSGYVASRARTAPQEYARYPVETLGLLVESSTPSAVEAKESPKDGVAPVTLPAHLHFLLHASALVPCVRVFSVPARYSGHMSPNPCWVAGKKQSKGSSYGHHRREIDQRSISTVCWFYGIIRCHWPHKEDHASTVGSILEKIPKHGQNPGCRVRQRSLRKFFSE